MIRNAALLCLATAACAGATRQPLPGSSGYTVLPSAPRRAVALLEPEQTPAGIAKTLAEAMARCDAELAKIVAIPDAERTFDNTVGALEYATAQLLDTTQRTQIWKDVHTDAAVRDAAAKAEEDSGQYLVKLGARRDLYQAVMGWKNGPGKGAPLDAQQARLVEILLRDFRRNGLALDDASLAKLVAIRSRLTSLSTEFSKNLNEDLSSIDLGQDELAGLPQDFVARLRKRDDGRFTVTTKYPDYTPFMENARSEPARKRLYLAFNTRQADRNVPILREAVKLRDDAAKLLGYAVHADYTTEDRMAHDAATVKAFLANVGTKLLPRRDADYARLTAIKRAESGDANAKLEPWDFLYLLNQWKKQDYALDGELIREYFPAEPVVQAMFGVYEQLFSLKIVPVENAKVWHASVKLYEIRDAASSEPMAWFYADLNPRDGKYGHAAVAPLNVPRELDGKYAAPLSVLMANFTPPANGKPGLLQHSEVTTLFHEFGHIVHNSLTRARYGSLSGFNVAGDFVEAPSQMLENWMFTAEVLDRVAGHWQDRSKKLSPDVIAKIKEARTFDAGYRYTRQVFLATYDQALHTSGSTVDPVEVERAQYAAIMGIMPPSEQRFCASFGHLMGGYDAGYYGYLWSEVFAADMFTRFEAEGVLNGQLGRRYRETILAKGRTLDADALLTEFLGRKPSDAAFLKKLGIK